MFRLNNFLNNQNMKVIEQKGPFRVLEHEKDLSVHPANAVTAYFASEMNVRKRQVFVELNGSGCITQRSGFASSIFSVVKIHLSFKRI